MREAVRCRLAQVDWAEIHNRPLVQLERLLGSPLTLVALSLIHQPHRAPHTAHHTPHHTPHTSLFASLTPYLQHVRRPLPASARRSAPAALLRYLPSPWHRPRQPHLDAPQHRRQRLRPLSPPRYLSFFLCEPEIPSLCFVIVTVVITVLFFYLCCVNNKSSGAHVAQQTPSTNNQQ